MAQILAGGSDPNPGGNTQVIQQVQTANWSQLEGKPFTTVSGKGIENGLSSIPNDGADFGPDTKLNATAPGQYGSSGNYTESTGLLEAWDYGVSIGTFNSAVGSSGAYMIPEIHLYGPIININSKITLSGNGKKIANPIIRGMSSMSPYIYCNVNSGYAITFDATSFEFANFQIDNMQPYKPSGYSPYGFLSIDFSTANAGKNLFQSYNIDVSNGGWGSYPIYLSSFSVVYMVNYQEYETSPGIGINGTNTVDFIGGILASAFIQGCTTVNFIGQSSGVSTGAVEFAGNLKNVTFIGSVFCTNYKGSQTTNIENLYSLNGVTGVYGNHPMNIGGSGTVNITNLVVDGLNYNSTSDLSFIHLGSGASVNITNSNIRNIVYGSSGILTSIPVNDPTTPAVPTSGSTYPNTLGYDVIIVPLTASGFTYTITDVAGNTTASLTGTAGGEILLKNGQIITPTYSTLTWYFRSAS